MILLQEPLHLFLNGDLRDCEVITEVQLTGRSVWECCLTLSGGKQSTPSLHLVPVLTRLHYPSHILAKQGKILEGKFSKIYSFNLVHFPYMSSNVPCVEFTYPNRTYLQQL